MYTLCLPKKISAFIVLLVMVSCRMPYKSNSLIDVKSIAWIHGSANCKENRDAAIQVVALNNSTFLLRQNKCVNYEAPFLFLFLGRDKALLMDTGATEDESKFPLYATVKKLLADWAFTHNRSVELIVAHTHAHGDHKAADSQFKNKPGVTVVGLGVDEVSAFFQLKNWPLQNARLDLGKRQLEIIPIPGHEKSSIAVYDAETRLLLSGDSFYPGRLYIQDWPAYQSSIQRLTDFADTHKISHILGNHIEMTNEPGKDYPTGTTYQPKESALPLTVADLQLLNTSLKKMGDTPRYEIHDTFIIVPPRKK